MSKTKIEWANFTWSPIAGCTKCSPGCDNCYAERMAKRLSAMGQLKYCGAVNSKKEWSGEISYVPDPPKFPKKPSRIFVNSMSDTFHELVEFRWIAQIFSVAAQNPQHVFIILTKRAKRMHEYFQLAARPPKNVWLGVTVCNQQEANEKIPLLMQVPATVRFASVEPMLGPINLNLATPCDRNCNEYQNSECPGGNGLCARQNDLNWVICGGESGPGARPMHPDWVRSLRDQCKAAGVPFLFKQWGDWVPRSGCCNTSTKKALIRLTDTGENGSDLGSGGSNDVWMERVGKHRAGRTLDGKIYDEYPEVPK